MHIFIVLSVFNSYVLRVSPRLGLLPFLPMEKTKQNKKKTLGHDLKVFISARLINLTRRAWCCGGGRGWGSAGTNNFLCIHAQTRENAKTHARLSSLAEINHCQLPDCLQPPPPPRQPSPLLVLMNERSLFFFFCF